MAAVVGGKQTDAKNFPITLTFLQLNYIYYTGYALYGCYSNHTTAYAHYNNRYKT